MIKTYYLFWGGVIIDITFDGNRLLLEKIPKEQMIVLPMQFHLDDQGLEITSDGYRLLLEKIPEDSSDVGQAEFHLDEYGLPIEQRKDIKH